jgi:hypothetical protein
MHGCVRSNNENKPKMTAGTGAALSTMLHRRGSTLNSTIGLPQARLELLRTRVQLSFFCAATLKLSAFAHGGHRGG